MIEDPTKKSNSDGPRSGEKTAQTDADRDRKPTPRPDDPLAELLHKEAAQLDPKAGNYKKFYEEKYSACLAKAAEVDELNAAIHNLNATIDSLNFRLKAQDDAAKTALVSARKQHNEQLLAKLNEAAKETEQIEKERDEYLAERKACWERLTVIEPLAARVEGLEKDLEQSKQNAASDRAACVCQASESLYWQGEHRKGQEEHRKQQEALRIEHREELEEHRKLYLKEQEEHRKTERQRADLEAGFFRARFCVWLLFGALAAITLGHWRASGLLNGVGGVAAAGALVLYFFSEQFCWSKPWPHLFAKKPLSWDSPPQRPN